MVAQDWTMVIAERDASGTPSTFGPGDLPELPEDSPIVRHECQEPKLDVGVGRVLVPTTSDKLVEFVEGRFVHLKVSGTTLTTMVVGATSETVVSPSGPSDELATVALRTVNCVLNEGTVPPALGFDIGSDLGNIRIFDFGDINRDNSDFGAVEDQGTVTDAQAHYGTYGSGIAYPGDVHLLGVSGSDLDTIDHDGYRFLYADLVFPDGTFKFRFRGSVATDLISLRVAGEEVLGAQFGYANAWQTDVDVTGDGVNPIRISAVIHNNTDPVLGPPNGVTACNMAMEIVQLDGGGGEGPDSSLFHATNDTDWFSLDFPTDAPGMTFTQVFRILLAENQAYGWLTDVVLDPTCDDETDSNGAAITEQWDMATRTRGPLGDFFFKEMGRFFCEIEVVADEVGGGVIVKLYSLGGRGTTATGYSIGEDDVTSFSIDREGTLTTDLMVEWAGGTHLLRGDDPPPGQPRSVVHVTVGAQQTLAQALRLAAPELGDISRLRVKIALTDVKTDGRDYWTADSIPDLPTDRFFTSDGDRVESMTWQVDRNGNLEFTSEFGDLVVPVVARPSLALSRMAPGHRTRIAS